jgi:Asp-tRNA(Asn)/Glu-tRNA(Gln) amidotransferase A subunit family amidase
VLQAQGATVDVVDFDFGIKEPLIETIGKLALAGPMGGMLAGYADKTDQLTHYGKHFVEKAAKGSYGPKQLEEVEAVIKKMWAALADQVYAKGYDLVLAPTMPTSHVPANYDFTKDDPLTEDGITFPKMVGGQYTLPFNLLNWCPVVSVPAGISSQGIPIGMQIIGKPHDTETVLRVAYAFSKGGPKLYTGKLFPKAADAK